MTNIIVNGKQYCVKDNQTILEACKEIGIEIPTLCYLKEFGPTSSCRVCLVEVSGQRNLITACSFKIFEGMEIITNSKRVIDARKTNLELILSNHSYYCDDCVSDKKCELQALVKEYNCNPDRFKGVKTEVMLDESHPSIVRDQSKCILCRKCINVCNKMQKVYAITQNKRGFNTVVGCSFNEGLKESPCVGCGQCILVCPTGALSENSNISQLQKVLSDQTKHVVVAPAPSVRVAIGEEFGLKNGTDTEKLLPTALRMLGFDKVFDVNFGADLTICEEATEFVNRVKNGGPFPMFTSCCPAWIDFAKEYYPELLPNISSCKSPQQMFGSVVKTYYADKHNINPADIVVVTVMPCTAKKNELTKPDMKSQNGQDIDISITVRELAKLLKSEKIDYAKLQPSEFDRLMGESSGAAVIFGNTGGVMEAALRTVADMVTGKDLEKIDYTAVRGLEGIKKATIKIDNKDFVVAVVSGLGNTRTLLEEIKSGKFKPHFVEVMSCPGGCINGGGMPRKTASTLNNNDIRVNRAYSIYKNDNNKKIRKSHKNPEIIEFYNWQKTAKNKPLLHTNIHK